MATTVHGATVIGVDAVAVRIEAQIFGSLRRFSLVGLPDGALRESKDRVRCAIQNSGFSFPVNEVIVSLAPASLQKYGAGFDLAIALSILAADGKISHHALSSLLVLGELALDGSVKSIPGALAISLYASKNDFEGLLLPEPNAPMGALNEAVPVYGIRSLVHATQFLNGEIKLNRAIAAQCDTTISPTVGFKDVVGQYNAKRALEIATAGGHNMLMVGPPGVGKSMLAKRSISLLPKLSKEEAIEITKVYSRNTEHNSGFQISQELITSRPFRSPHHTTSTAGLIGGGSSALPGEISLAHRGVLFLDELPEFNRSSLESLREPLETNSITISRAKFRTSLPSDFILIAAMNPCPCGRRGSGAQDCVCSINALHRYNTKLSGPLLDRIDLHIWVSPIPVAELQSRNPDSDPTEDMQKRVGKARQNQQMRFRNRTKLNASMETEDIRKFCLITSRAAKMIQTTSKQLHLSARAYTRLLKVARTIADLEDSADIKEGHLYEAISYRSQPKW